MIRVSYVVTVYNKAPYLPFLLDGLARQQGGFAREFVFVDDGSSDGSLDALRALTATWVDCRVIAQTNAGPSLAMNAGLAAARGDFVKALDGDDMLTPDATQVLLDAISATSAGLAFGKGGSYRREDGLERARAAAEGSPQAGAAEPLADTLRQCLRRAQTTPSAWLARGELVRASGGCDPGVLVQDYSLELRMARLAPFARTRATLFLAPERAPGRMSEHGAQELHDLNLALANFVAATPELPPELKRLALKRAAGRAWHFARRQGGRGRLSREFAAFLAAHLRFGAADAARIRATCRVFRELAPIRLTALEQARPPLGRSR
ncbi:MAG TPA: glycosyltransferase family 2 protein [Alphaproteobacteria bacterium]|nr:glycosyltransferase family 2 protein [Alphaproteobacteria bacterium]